MATCKFLQNFSFASLIAPVSEEEFRACYWEQQPLIVHRKNPGYYGDLFTVRDFDEAVVRAPGHIKMADAASNKGTTLKPTTVRGLEALLTEMREGGSLVLEQLHRQDPKLGLFCRMLGQQLGHMFEAVLFLTPPHGKSSLPHWDNTDVFIVQLFGSKHWQIEQKRRLFPVRPYRMSEDERREFGGRRTSFTVDQGDVVYIPRGFMHVAECGSQASLHLSLGVVPVVLEELLHAAIKAAVRRNQKLRVALPLGFMQGHEPQMIDAAKTALREAADETFLRAVLDQFRDELVQSSPLDISGQIANFFEPAPLTLETLVGPRRGLVYRIEAGDDFVRVKVGTRSIAFPGLFRQTLEFALNTAAFTVGAIVGALEDETKIAVIERLIEEGLVVRL